MKSIREYIYEQKELDTPINEVGIALLCLGGAIATHFAVKGMRKISKYTSNFWGWATGDKELSVSNASESRIIEANEKFDKSKVQPAIVPDQKTLDILIEMSEPKAPKNGKGGNGFYVFDSLLKDNKDLKKLNKAPYYPNYVMFMDAGSKDNEEEKPNFYGMIGFSAKYWKVLEKKGSDDKLKEAGHKYQHCLNIFAIQTHPKYAKNGLLEIYIEYMKKAVKELKMHGITVVCNNDDLAKIYAKYGFEKCDDIEGYMLLNLNDE